MPNLFWSQDQADRQFAVDYVIAVYGAIRDIGFETWIGLDEVRRAVVTDMTYEMGRAGLAEFHHFLTALEVGDWPTAQIEMLASRWAKQVSTRADDNSEMMLSGVWSSKVLPAVAS